jgi:hypothetical protein
LKKAVKQFCEDVSKATGIPNSRDNPEMRHIGEEGIFLHFFLICKALENERELLLSIGESLLNEFGERGVSDENMKVFVAKAGERQKKYNELWPKTADEQWNFGHEIFVNILPDRQLPDAFVIHQLYLSAIAFVTAASNARANYEIVGESDI